MAGQLSNVGRRMARGARGRRRAGTPARSTTHMATAAPASVGAGRRLWIDVRSCPELMTSLPARVPSDHQLVRLMVLFNEPHAPVAEQVR